MSGHDQDSLDGRGLTRIGTRIGHVHGSFRGGYGTTLAIMRRVTSRSTGVVALWLLLAGFLLLGALPNQTASIRLGGLSLLWWYGGVLAPVMGVLVAIRWLAGPLPAPRRDG